MSQTLLRIVGPKDTTPPGATIVNTTSRGPHTGLSPFFLGPIELPQGWPCSHSRTLENAWQYAKVYAEHLDGEIPSPAYWRWAQAGWQNPRAVRYPMGRGARPAFSLWRLNGEIRRLSYIEARLHIYIPMYAQAVVKTSDWENLRRLWQKHQAAGNPLYLWDFDGYPLTTSLKEAVQNPAKKLGHAFVLYHLLTQEPFA